MSRKPFVIKKTNGSMSPSLCIAIDVHKPGPGAEPTVAVCIARLSKGQVIRQSVQTGGWQHAISLIAAHCRPHQSVWLVSRNLHESLVQMRFFDAMTAGLFDIKRVADKGGGVYVHEPHCCYLICHRRDGGRLTCVDAANYGVRSLPGWSEYPTANAELLMEWWASWLAWIADNDAGSLRLTLASQAHYCYRKRFMRHDIVVHGRDEVLDLESAALTGGRCEAFRLGELPSPIYHLDARSLYGAMAAQYDVPVSLADYQEGQPCPKVGASFGVAADVTIEVESPIVPYRASLLADVTCGLPGEGSVGISIKAQTVPITVWPIGKFRMTLCGPELDLVQGSIIKTHRWAVYRMAPALKDFAEWNWRKRAAADILGYPVLASQLKQWSQFCFGRWAQRYRGWLPDSKGTCIEPWEMWWEWDKEQGLAVPHRAVAGKAEVFEDRGLAVSACPVITAWINSLARRWLLGAITTAGQENVYYVDTDSLMVNAAGLSRLGAGGFRIGSGLGDLRLVGEHQRVSIYGWKHYECDGVLTCAGLPISRRGGVMDHVAGEAAEALTAAAVAGRPPREAPAVGKYRRSAQYRHGIVQGDGRVLPHVLGSR